MAELDEIGRLEAGWLDSGTPAPDAAALRGARRLAAVFAESELPEPHAFPGHDGSVSFEWSLDDLEASIMFENSETTATFAALHMSTDRRSYAEGQPVDPDSVRSWMSGLVNAGGT